MDKVLTTALLTIAAVVAAIMVVNTILPALGTGGSSVVSSSRAAADRIKTAIEIIHVAPPSSGEIHFWVKNVGAIEIQDIDNADVFVEDSLMTFYEGGASCSDDDDDDKWFHGHVDTGWTPSTTLEIIVCLSSESNPNTVRFITANGVTAKKSF